MQVHDDTIDLTIGLPVRNEEKDIERVIKELQAQTFEDYVLFISDNASTDNTGEICRRLSDQDPRIFYNYHEENMGTLFNFKFVLSQAQTPFFMWAGGHDGWEPEYCSRLMNEFKKNEELVLVYSKNRRILKGGQPAKIFDDNHTTVSIKKPEERFLKILKELGACNIFHGIWRTEVLQKYGLKPSVGPDNILIIQTSLEGTFKQIDEVLFYRHKSKKQNSTRSDERKKWGRALAMMNGTEYRKLTKSEVIKEKVKFSRILLLTLFRNDIPLGLITKLAVFFKASLYLSWNFFIKPFLKKLNNF